MYTLSTGELVEHNETEHETANGPRESVRLTNKQLLALEAIATRTPDESMSDVAQRAGISRTTLWRYMSDDTFYIALQLRVRNVSRSFMPAIMKGLCIAAAKGDAGCQRIYWQLAGKLQESIEVTTQRRGVENATINVDNLPSEMREELLKQIKGGVKENSPNISPDIRRPGYIDVEASKEIDGGDISDSLSENLDLFAG